MGAPGEPIIATDITDENGQYLFSGLPANGTEDYLVWVNDTNNVLGDLVADLRLERRRRPTPEHQRGART